MTLRTATPTHLSKRVFTIEDQRRFAWLTGDENPVHLDPVLARRTLVGRVVVHGIHTLVWTLESYLASVSAQPSGLVWRPGTISATFRQPVHLHQRVDAVVVSDAADAVHLRAVQDDVVVMDLHLRGDFLARGRSWRLDAASDDLMVDLRTPVAPADRRGDDLQGRSGSVDVLCRPADVLADFPLAGAALEPPVLAQLLSLSTLVGMECPGLHSLLSAVSVDVREPPAVADDVTTLRYHVRRFAPIYSLVDMAVEGSCLTGTVLAFLRPLPAAQPTMAVVARDVGSAEFEGQRALVVGGSRGLGELAAKIVAAGGGHPIITYVRGAQDARRVAEDIRGAGCRCDIVPFDVTHAQHSVNGLTARVLAEDLGAPTHLYYFATPRIAVRKADVFNDRLFDGFLDFYVRGFVATVLALSDATATPVRVLYPSTVYIDEAPPGFAEYVAAKAAGEAAGRVISRTRPDVHILSVRLPRLPTDQTADVRGTASPEPLPLLLDAVRTLHRGPSA